MKQRIKRITAWIMAFLSVVTSLCSNGVIKVFAASPQANMAGMAGLAAISPIFPRRI